MTVIATSTASRGFDPSRRILLLFVAGDGPNSVRARDNLHRLLEGESTAAFDLDIIDVLEDFERAQRHGILVTPSLLLARPPLRRLIVGTLADLATARAALGLPWGGRP